MELYVNGALRADLAVDNVGALLRALGLARDGVAVALNGAVVPRSQHDQTPVRTGDRVEIIQAVGGG